jgi:mannosyltransferase OCH1-like enzyme
MTIPKKIHYCWLSGEPIPKHLQKCMQTWRDKMPDYEWVLWDKNRFDINSVDFVREACAAKKWAFAADYIRAYALYTEGGIYLDTDVVALKSFNDFLQYDFFTAVECTASMVGKLEQARLQAAILGGIKGHPYLKDVLNWYETHHFSDNEYNHKFIAPDVYAALAEKYGFQHQSELQKLANNMVIFPGSVLAPNNFDLRKDTCYAVHFCNGSWWTKRHTFMNFLIRNNLLRRLFGKKMLTSLDDAIKGNF